MSGAKTFNKARHGDGFFVAASPSIQSLTYRRALYTGRFMSKLLVTLFFGIFIISVSAQETYLNPVDGKGYVADSWTVHKPQVQKPQQNDQIQMSGMVLLTEEHVIENNLKIHDLVAFIDQVKIAIEQTSSMNEQGELLLQFELNSSANFNLRMSYAGELSDTFLKSIFDDVKKVESINTHTDVVTFQIKFIVRGNGL